MLLPQVLTGQLPLGLAEVTLGTGGECYSRGGLGGNRRFVKSDDQEPPRVTAFGFAENFFL